MATRDRAKRLAAQRRYRQKLHDEKYGPGVGNMSGRHGNHARGPANARYNGGRVLTGHGYVGVRVPSDHPHAWGAHPSVKYAYEHILVMEAHLGRPLTEDEAVHHRNHNRGDNRLENLELLTRSDHARGHSLERGRDSMGRFPPADLRVREMPAMDREARRG